MTKNRKISLAIAGAMLISIFLPFAKVGNVSLLDAAQAPIGSAVPITLIVLVVVFGILTFINKHLLARLCSIIILGVLVYRIVDAPAGANIFSFLGIGAYLLLISSILGAIFSKPE